jgi:UPF0716 protein FxsA
MFRILLILFLLIPLIEIYLLIKVGGLIGALPTITLVVFTAVLGALIIRFQGFSVMSRVRLTLARGEVPAIEMMEGAVLLVAGALLLTPGFFTDTLGFLCLIPSLRQSLIVWFIQRHVIMSGVSTRNTRQDKERHHKPRIIEGESWRVDDSNDR